MILVVRTLAVQYSAGQCSGVSRCCPCAVLSVISRQSLDVYGSLRSKHHGGCCHLLLRPAGRPCNPPPPPPPPPLPSHSHLDDVCNAESGCWCVFADNGPLHASGLHCSVMLLAVMQLGWRRVGRCDAVRVSLCPTYPSVGVLTTVLGPAMAMV